MQYELLKALVGERGRFTAVGDDDQSIYGWRGATLDNLKRLPQDYPKLKVIKLEQNYRSTGAHPARGQQRDRGRTRSCSRRRCGASSAKASRCAWSMRQRGARGRARGGAHPGLRARRTAPRRRRSSGRDFAVLYRANHQARVFEQALRTAQIPYKVSGGQSFFDRAEIKDLCAWLRLWSTTTTTRPSCARSPRPSAASATRRWPSWASSRASGS